MQGWIMLYRKLVDSEIMKKPPMYLKVFIWLLLHAQHKDYNSLKRGQYKTSIPEIIEAMSYRVGYRTEKPSKKEIFGIIEWLRNPNEKNGNESRNLYEGNYEGSMIVTTKVTHGFVYNIVNYDVYQTQEDNEGNDEGLTKVQRRSRQGNNINNNVNNDNNEKKLLKEYVFLSTDEYQKLTIDYGLDKAEEYIQRLNDYIAQIGVKDAQKKYKSHYHTILNWIRRDKDKPKQTYSKNNKTPQETNYEQRKYDDEFYKSLYDNV